MSEHAEQRRRRRYAELAVELHEISVRPQNRGRKWDWMDIGLALGISAPSAQRLVRWMRKNYTEQYWTVGIYKSDYLVVPTVQGRVALDGMLNQQMHLITRLSTMVQSCMTLANIDPDPAWSHFMELNVDHFTSMLRLEKDFSELLVTRADALGWQPMEREEAP